MAKKGKNEQIARGRARKLLRQIHSLGPVLRASVVKRRFRCGKPGCRCMRGHLHKDLVVTRKVQGRTQTIRVRTGREKEALEWLENWRRMKRLLERLTSIEIEILRMPAEGAAKQPGRKRGKRGR